MSEITSLQILMLEHKLLAPYKANNFDILKIIEPVMIRYTMPILLLIQTIKKPAPENALKVVHAQYQDIQKQHKNRCIFLFDLLKSEKAELEQTLSDLQTMNTNPERLKEISYLDSNLVNDIISDIIKLKEIKTSFISSNAGVYVFFFSILYFILAVFIVKTLAILDLKKKYFTENERLFKQ